METEDDSFNYEDEDDGIEALSPMTDLTQGSFSREDLINAQELRSSYYKNKALRMIREKNGSMEYKQELAQWIQSFFTEEHILADRSDQRRGMLKTVHPLDKIMAEAELELAKCALASCKYDQMQSWSKTLPPLLLKTFEAYVSRSAGKDRERMITNKLITSQEVKQTMTKETPIGEPKKKRRFW